MPTYDYECQACQHRFERYQEIRAPKLRTCPACGKRRLHRLVGAGAGLIFRGSGFYETDYKRAAAKTGAKPASESGAKSAEAGAAKSPAAGATSAGERGRRSEAGGDSKGAQGTPSASGGGPGA